MHAVPGLLSKFTPGVGGVSGVIKIINENNPVSYSAEFTERGYGIVFSEEKKVVSSVMQVKENEIIRIVLNDGGLSAKVLEAEPKVQPTAGK